MGTPYEDHSDRLQPKTLEERAEEPQVLIDLGLIRKDYIIRKLRELNVSGILHEEPKAPLSRKEQLEQTRASLEAKKKEGCLTPEEIELLMEVKYDLERCK